MDKAERRKLAQRKYALSLKGRKKAAEWTKKNRIRLNKKSNEYYHKNREWVIANHIESNRRNKKHIYKYRRGWVKTLRGKMHQYLGRIRHRCNSVKAHNYKYYGGRGIKCYLNVNDLIYLWKRDNADKLRWASIDRIKNNEAYSRRNCRFIEHTENISRNRGGKGQI